MPSKKRLSGGPRMMMVRRLARAHGWFCWWCGIRLNADTATIDHLVTKSAGGSNRFENSALACEPCNWKRKDTPAGEYRPIIRHREPETAAPAIPMGHAKIRQVGTTISRAEADWLTEMLGNRVAGSTVHENGCNLKNRRWRIMQRAYAATLPPNAPVPRDEPGALVDA